MFATPRREQEDDMSPRLRIDEGHYAGSES